MKNIQNAIIVLLALMLTACKVTSPVPMPKTPFQQASQVNQDKVLVVVEGALANKQHKETMIMTDFQYDIGRYLSHSIKDSLNSRYQTVDVASDDTTAADYDIVIKPRLVQFAAPVPIQVYLRTKSQVEIEYSVIPKAPLKPFVITAKGDYELDNEEEEAIYNMLSVTGPDKDFYYYDVSTGIGMTIPNYAYVAGRDSAIAIRQSLVSLLSQLKDKLDKS